MQGVEASLGVATMSRAEGIAEAATWGGRCRQRAERRALDRVVSCREKSERGFDARARWVQNVRHKTSPYC